MPTNLPTTCPRCGYANPPQARFCAACGLALERTPNGPAGAGQVRHPQPAPVPPGAIPIEEATQLYFVSESALGGNDLSGTEGLRITITNVGYALQELQLEVRGVGRDGATVLLRTYEVEELPHAASVELEVPSYDVTGPLRILHLKRTAAHFAPPEDDN